MVSAVTLRAAVRRNRSYAPSGSACSVPCWYRDRKFVPAASATTVTTTRRPSTYGFPPWRTRDSSPIVSRVARVPYRAKHLERNVRRAYTSFCAIAFRARSPGRGDHADEPRSIADHERRRTERGSKVNGPTIDVRVTEE